MNPIDFDELVVDYPWFDKFKCMRILKSRRRELSTPNRGAWAHGLKHLGYTKENSPPYKGGSYSARSEMLVEPDNNWISLHRRETLIALPNGQYAPTASRGHAVHGVVDWKMNCRGLQPVVSVSQEPGL